MIYRNVFVLIVLDNGIKRCSLIVKHHILVYTTQVNSAFRASWLVNSEVISKLLFTFEQLKRNKLPSRVDLFTESDVSVR